MRLMFITHTPCGTSGLSSAHDPGLCVPAMFWNEGDAAPMLCSGYIDGSLVLLITTKPSAGPTKFGVPSGSVLHHHHHHHHHHQITRSSHGSVLVLSSPLIGH
jgi:hypothetical protein